MRSNFTSSHTPGNCRRYATAPNDLLFLAVSRDRPVFSGAPSAAIVWSLLKSSWPPLPCFAPKLPGRQMGHVTRVTMAQKISPMPFFSGGPNLVTKSPRGDHGGDFGSDHGAPSGVTFRTIERDLTLVRGGTGMAPFDTRLVRGIPGSGETGVGETSTGAEDGVATAEGCDSSFFSFSFSSSFFRARSRWSEIRRFHPTRSASSFFSSCPR